MSAAPGWRTGREQGTPASFSPLAPPAPLSRSAAGGPGGGRVRSEANPPRAQAHGGRPSSQMGRITTTTAKSPGRQRGSGRSILGGRTRLRALSSLPLLRSRYFSKLATPRRYEPEVRNRRPRSAVPIRIVGGSAGPASPRLVRQILPPKHDGTLSCCSCKALGRGGGNSSAEILPGGPPKPPDRPDGPGSLQSRVHVSSFPGPPRASTPPAVCCRL